MRGGGRLAGMFPTGVGLGAIRCGTDGTGLEGATGAARCGTDAWPPADLPPPCDDQPDDAGLYTAAHHHTGDYRLYHVYS